MWQPRTMIVGLKSVTMTTQLRRLTMVSAKYKDNLEDKMQAWQIHSYGGLDEFKMSNGRFPVISRPTDVLVKVEAASVNPIDLAISRGYGSTVLNLMRKAKSFKDGVSDSEIEFPLTMGRDFSGYIVSKGHGVGGRLHLGDEVWGVVPVEQQGCHASYVVVDSNLVNPRPKNLSYIEASCILYAGLTAWSALWLTGGLCFKTIMATRQNRRILVLGGSGGVGTQAIQMLKAWNMQVITTCSSDAIELLEKLRADTIIDYKSEDADLRIYAEGPYEIILDCCNLGPDAVKAKGYPHNTYITLNSPLLKNIDKHGLFGGTVRNIGDLVRYNIPRAENKSTVKWGFFAPSQTGINMLQDLVENGEVLPVIKKVYPFSELPKAYERVSQGHLRGKIVIDMK